MRPAAMLRSAAARLRFDHLLRGRRGVKRFGVPVGVMTLGIVKKAEPEFVEWTPSAPPEAATPTASGRLPEGARAGAEDRDGDRRAGAGLSRMGWAPCLLTVSHEAGAFRSRARQ